MKRKRSKRHSHNSVKDLVHVRDTAFARFPLLFTLLVTFGLSATLYGMGKIVETIPLFVDHPVIPLVVGLVILLLTGRLYKKLG